MGWEIWDKTNMPNRLNRQPPSSRDEGSLPMVPAAMALGSLGFEWNNEDALKLRNSPEAGPAAIHRETCIQFRPIGET